MYLIVDNHDSFTYNLATWSLKRDATSRSAPAMPLDLAKLPP